MSVAVVAALAVAVVAAVVVVAVDRISVSSAPRGVKRQVCV